MHCTQRDAPSQTLPEAQATPFALGRFWQVLSELRQNASSQTPALRHAPSVAHCTQRPDRQLPSPNVPVHELPSACGSGSHVRVLVSQCLVWQAPAAGQSASPLQPPHLPEPSHTPAAHLVPRIAFAGRQTPACVSQRRT